ncbi:aflatoxin B1-aldehyde reductase [Irpex lacteus]|nr:aflatoxin B1-aldehyde reductase [Irpex lacteus]
MSRIPLILGTGMWGHLGTHSRIEDSETAQRFVDVMLNHGHVGVDTAQNYGNGTSEKVEDVSIPRFSLKIFPNRPGYHKAERLKNDIKKSVQDLGPHKIRVFYLHAPDHATPFEETLEAVNNLYQQGVFEEFGLGNFMSWEVAEVVGICVRRGFVTPTVYEGVYNLLDRTPEGELFPCLRKFGIRFAAYSTLAGGYLTGKHLETSPEANTASNDHPDSHFHPESALSLFFLTRYPPMAAAVTKPQAVANKHAIPLAEVSYRWLQWHSRMIPGDHGVILGASRVEQLEAAVLGSSKGPLPDEIVAACEQTWLEVRGSAKDYWLDDLIFDFLAEANQ